VSPAGSGRSAGPGRSAGRLGRRTAVAVVLAAVAILSACAGHPPRPADAPAKRTAPGKPSSSTHAGARVLGVPGHYRVGEREETFIEPAHRGPTGEYLGPRTLVTEIRYPLASPSVGSAGSASAGSRPARGPWPLLVFGPGFMMCSGSYAHLLQAWASAGYLVAAVDFPRTNCRVAAPDEGDLVNQPGDLSYVISQMLALSAQPHDVFSGLVNQHEIGAAGQSDGGDTVAALAANTCCSDSRLAAVAVLSGAEWPPMPGPYFARGAPPMLFVQGSADTINPPWTSLQLYQADGKADRYYLDLFGADHLEPYVGTNPVQRLAVRVSIAFFDRYLLGQARAQTTMTRDGNVRGAAALVSGGTLPP
jgi:chlorophyllase-like protein